MQLVEDILLKREEVQYGALESRTFKRQHSKMRPQRLGRNSQWIYSAGGKTNWLWNNISEADCKQSSILLEKLFTLKGLIFIKNFDSFLSYLNLVVCVCIGIPVRFKA